jgi:aldehyde dehydrogenase (NAD+)
MQHPTDVRTEQLLVGGDWRGSESGRTFESIDPYTGRVWANVPLASASDVDTAVRAARTALDDGPWGRMTGVDRARLMRRLATLVAENSESLALLESTDNGKLYRESLTQCRRLADAYDYFAGAADKLHGTTIPGDSTDYLIYTVKEPIGVVGVVLPWNSPLSLLGYKLAPGLAAGCTFVVKPAEQTSSSTLAFGRLFEEAGFPPGVFNIVTGAGEVGRALVRHPAVNKVAFTGSTETGIAIMKDAADHLAKVSLELGGKSPNIVFDDADDGAVNGIVAGIFAASGQTCVAGSRLLLQNSVYDRIVDEVVLRARKLRLGDPFLPETEMGPIAFREQRDKILSYVKIAEDEGAVISCGGGTPTGEGLSDGLFVEPTVITNVDNGMRVAQEEIFGPVLSVLRFDDEDDAVATANASAYGLAAGIWTRDVRRAHRMVRRLDAGTVWVNMYRAVSYHTPFGGFKMSGNGVDNGLESIGEYTRVKTAWVELSGADGDPFVLR